jgi:hypothetical protein
MLYQTSQITLLRLLELQEQLRLEPLEELVLLQPLLEQLLLLVPLHRKRRLHSRWCCRKKSHSCCRSLNHKSCRSLNRKSCRMMFHIRHSLALIRSTLVLACRLSPLQFCTSLACTSLACSSDCQLRLSWLIPEQPTRERDQEFASQIPLQIRIHG